MEHIEPEHRGKSRVPTKTTTKKKRRMTEFRSFLNIISRLPLHQASHAPFSPYLVFFYFHDESWTTLWFLWTDTARWWRVTRYDKIPKSTTNKPSNNNSDKRHLSLGDSQGNGSFTWLPHSIQSRCHSSWGYGNLWRTQLRLEWRSVLANSQNHETRWWHPTSFVCASRTFSISQKENCRLCWTSNWYRWSYWSSHERFVTQSSLIVNQRRPCVFQITIYFDKKKKRSSSDLSFWPSLSDTCDSRKSGKRHHLCRPMISFVHKINVHISTWIDL